MLHAVRPLTENSCFGAVCGCIASRRCQPTDRPTNCVMTRLASRARPSALIDSRALVMVRAVSYSVCHFIATARALRSPVPSAKAGSSDVGSTLRPPYDQNRAAAPRPLSTADGQQHREQTVPEFRIPMKSKTEDSAGRTAANAELWHIHPRRAVQYSTVRKVCKIRVGVGVHARRRQYRPLRRRLRCYARVLKLKSQFRTAWKPSFAG